MCGEGEVSKAEQRENSEEQISFTLIPELREGEELKVELSFKMRLRLKYQTEMVPNTLGG